MSMVIANGLNISLPNISSPNTSVYDELLEFPLWQPLVTINILLPFGILTPTTLFMNLSVFTALIKSKVSDKPLLVLYGSLLLALCLDKLLYCLDIVIFIPLQIRYCFCSTAATLFGFYRVFFYTYTITIVTCQSVLQLLILKGRKKLRTDYTRNILCVIISAIISVFWTLIVTVDAVIRTPQTFCESFCCIPEENSTSLLDNILLVPYFAFTFAPALVTTIVTSIWSLVVFKKSIIQQDTSDNDSALNKKVILLPLLMSFLVLNTGLIAFIVGQLISVHLNASNGTFFGNWGIFVVNLVDFFVQVPHGVSYPVILLYLNTKLRQVWKRMIRKTCAKQSNKIQPLAHDTSSTQDETY